MPMNPRLLRPTQGGFISPDADARAYLAAVRIADGANLEPRVAKAISDFVIGCKTDGIWNAIKASCILAGAKTLAGALTPLKGTAPTNNNFVGGDYDRKTGLVGNGTNKTLNSNRNSNTDPQDSFHAAMWIHTADTNSNRVYFGAGPLTNETGASNFGRGASNVYFFRCRNGSIVAQPAGNATGLVGMSRSSSANFVHRTASTSATQAATSQTPVNGDLFVFSATNSAFATSARASFYSIGESLDLALLDTRLATLTTAIGNAIP
jgi:hypothetical protein